MLRRPGRLRLQRGPWVLQERPEQLTLQGCELLRRKRLSGLGGRTPLRMLRARRGTEVLRRDDLPVHRCRAGVLLPGYRLRDPLGQLALHRLCGRLRHAVPVRGLRRRFVRGAGLPGLLALSGVHGLWGLRLQGVGAWAGCGVVSLTSLTRSRVMSRPAARRQGVAADTT